MKKLILILTVGVLFTACAESTKKTVRTPAAIIGLASPVRLNIDTTIVHLLDYLPEISKLKSVSLDGEIIRHDSTGLLVITTGIKNPVGNLSLDYDGLQYDIPVFRSGKIKYRFVYRNTDPSIKEVQVAGNMNGWNRKATNLSREGEEWIADLVLAPGLYQYRLWIDGKEKMDDTNANTMDNGMGGLNNTFNAGEVQQSVSIATLFQVGSEIRIFTGASQPSVVAYHENRKLDVNIKDQVVSVVIPENAQSIDRSHIRVYGFSNQSRTNDLLIPLQNGKVIKDAGSLTRSDMHAAVMYFVLLDRFVDGDTANNRPTMDPQIAPEANNLGGDLSGITQKIKDGYFQKLGINTIWISPITTNAEGAWGLWKNKPVQGSKEKEFSSRFSAYHGYWPTSLRTIDDRFGSEAQMKELIDVAHSQGMNVILDYVAHHVHQDHPLYKQQPGWTTPLYLPDGRMNTELWDEQRLTTWFDTFLPTWDFSKPEVVDALTDTAMFWVEHYDLDGFRHDATKHIPSEFWRSLTFKVKEHQRKNDGRYIYQVGETYGNPELISSYVGSGQLDAQFDFNLYDAAVDAFAKDETNFENLERVLNQSLEWYGHHHLMGNITGNQDRARFISYADGSVRFDEDAKQAGWMRDINNADSTGYKKLRLLSAFLMTTPGVPCIYYGDEIGMPGGNDPDNRRMMHFDDWNEWQQKLFNSEQELVTKRRNSLALTYGSFTTLHKTDKTWIFMRQYFDKIEIVGINKTTEAVDHFITDRYLIDLHSELGVQATLKSNPGATRENILNKELMGIPFDIPAMDYRIMTIDISDND